MRSLTPRQREILAYVASGMRFHEVGEVMHLSRHTVRNQIVLARETVNAVSIAHLVAIAVAAGEIEVRDGIASVPKDEELYGCGGTDDNGKYLAGNGSRTV
jgi:DNA-binding CsgD family transcriptional regulator